jgi:hypothetical protein
MQSEPPAIRVLDSTSLTTVVGGVWVRVANGVSLKKGTIFKDEFGIKRKVDDSRWGSSPVDSEFGRNDPFKKKDAFTKNDPLFGERD